MPVFRSELTSLSYDGQRPGNPDSRKPSSEKSIRFASSGAGVANAACPYARSSLAFLRLLVGDDFGGFPRNGVTCWTLRSRQEERPEVTAHAKLTPYKAEQKQYRDLLPEGLGRGQVDL